MKHALILGTIALSLAVTTAASAQRTTKSEPCCTVKAVDLKSATVTAEEPSTKRVFRFTVKQADLLKGIKVGDQVYADFATGRVSLHPGEPCCNIAGSATNRKAALPVATVDVNPAAPCCEITAIDLNNGIITTHEPTNGRTFQFAVKQAHLLKGLKVGDKVYADFASEKVSLRPGEPCCTITRWLK